MGNDESGALKGNILIVDDTLDNLRLLSNMLTEHGYKVRGVPSGAMALTAAGSAPPDLILLDINMPAMNGYEVCQHLKNDERTRDIPIIFISALGEVMDKVKAFTVGGIDYITKPFQFEEVLARAETHLRIKRLQRELRQANDDLEKRVRERTAELVQLNESYERFVPREFLSFLKKKSITEVGLGDQVQRDMTIMFSDIRDFTLLSETMTPQENFNFINSYLSRVGPIIRQNHGFIDKYIGDAVMALFPNEAGDALRAAIAIRDELIRYNVHRRERNYQPINIGTALHTGSLMIGIVGEAERMEGTVISDAVNLASRLEGLTKLYGASIVVSEETLTHLEDKNSYNFRFLDKVRVKGKKEPVSVFEVFDVDPEATLNLKLKTKPDFEEGLLLYHDKKFAEASVRFDSVLKHNPDDKAARLYLQRAAHFMVHGVPPDWGGVESLPEK
jgi:two-component system sensor histidine kinase ChiS